MSEKYITFLVPIQKVIIISKNREEITQIISYGLKLIDSARFMARPLSNFVNNFAEGIHNIKHKYRHDGKKLWNMRN